MRSFNIRISPELHKKLSLLALELNVSMNSCVESAIKIYLEKHKPTASESSFFETDYCSKKIKNAVKDNITGFPESECNIHLKEG